MAAAKTKSDKKTSQKKADKGDLPLSERKLFFLILGGAFVVAILASLSPVREVFLSQYGVFSNAAVLFYLVAFGYGLKGITGLNAENGKRWRALALVSLLALFMAGEELNWGLSLFAGVHESWPVQSLRDLIALSLLGVPAKADIVLVGFIAAVRWILLLAVIYGAGMGLYHREKTSAVWKKYAAHPAVFYGSIFVALFIAGILMHAGFIPGQSVLGPCLRLCAALAFLMGSLQVGEQG